MEGDENLELEQLLGGLGELPVTVRTERGERFTGERPEPPPGPGGVLRLPQGVQMPVPRDVINQNVAELAARDAPAEPQLNPFQVTSTFPAMPVNAQQFLTSPGEIDLEPNANGAAVLTGTVTFTVPDGVNGIWRGFRFATNQPLANNPAFVVTALARGVVHKTYEQVVLGQIVTEFLPIYALAGPRQTFQIKIDNTTGPLIGYAPTIRVWMTGQLLVDTGRELQYEPANEREITGAGRTRRGRF